MAITDTQKLKLFEILSVSYTTNQLTIDWDSLDEVQETVIGEIITAYDKVRFNSNKIQTDGVTIDPRKQERLLRNRLIVALGVSDLSNAVYINQ